MSASPMPSFFRMTVSEFLRTGFLGKPPSRTTIKSLIDSGEWQGEKVGGLYFLFVDDNCQPIKGKPPIADPSTGNAEVDALIMKWNQSKK